MVFTIISNNKYRLHWERKYKIIRLMQINPLLDKPIMYYSDQFLAHLYHLLSYKISGGLSSKRLLLGIVRLIQVTL